MTIYIDGQISREDESVLIISSPTGIFYEGQCGGLACSHPVYEGFVIMCGSLGQDLDICGKACHYLQRMPEVAQELAKEFDVLAKEYTDGYPYQVHFDHSRIKEMQESWIPVIINGKLEHDSRDILIDRPAILYTNNNCD